MSIVLVGSTSGSITLQEPAVAGTTVINLPATSGTMAVTGGSPSFATLTVTGDASISGLTVGKGGGATTYATAVGLGALAANTSGSGNTAFGYNSLNLMTTGSQSTAIGNFSLPVNTTGTENTAVGSAALYSNTTGNYNTSVGRGSLQSNTTASNNTAVGYQAGFSNTTGGGNSGQNTFIGDTAGYSTTSDLCTFVGRGAGSSVTSGRKNTILGTYNGNQGGLDIRTLSNRIVISDGDGNPKIYVNESGRCFIAGGFTEFPGVGNTANGFMVEETGSTYTSRASGYPVSINRNTDDGTLVSLRQAGTEEGSISVSGTTVSFNGGHLSRWSQLPDGSKNNSIVKGTVMSNLDDMCVWEKDGVVAENEQLNKMKVSDVEGDTNVAGVFVNWTMDEAYGVDDMNVAMTGDMIIRIAQGVVVQKGDLLTSAGDGTAKPQGDDIRRSKTVAKVTSNHVTCTYADGSYCVPCVLMAC